MQGPAQFLVVLTLFFQACCGVSGQDELIFDKDSPDSIDKIYNNDTPGDVGEVFSLLDRGDREINLWTNRNLILVLGDHDSGKRSLIPYLAGYSRKHIPDDAEKYSSSETLFPMRLTIDPASRASFVDCPAFSGDRSGAQDIAAAYFMKQIMDHANRVKLLFVLSYDAVRPGYDVDAFSDLLVSAVKLVKEIKKYRHATALAVTWVETAPLYTDSVVEETIRHYLEKTKFFLPQKYNSSESIRVNIDAQIELIDFFLDSSLCNKILIFRTPDIPGPHAQPLRLKEGKDKALQKVRKLKFVSKESLDFDFPLEVNLVSYINEHLIDNIYMTVYNTTNVISQDLITHFKTIGRSQTSLPAKQVDFANFYEELFFFFTTQPSLLEFKRIIYNCISYLIREASSTISHEMFGGMLNQYIFFERYSNRTINPYGFWIGPLTTAKTLEKNLNYWYTALIDFSQGIQQYEFQKVKFKVLDPKLARLSYTVCSSYINDFLSFMIDSKISSNNSIWETLQQTDQRHLDGFVFDDINIVTAMLKTTVECSETGLLSIHAHVITVSIDVLLSTQIICKAKVTEIEIFAFQKIYVDADLVFNRSEAGIIIIAPVWEIVGKRTVDLHGMPGEVHGNSQAPSASIERQRGADGKPGNPGYPGGSFLGIGLRFINEDKLTVITDGGDGGPGQNGGDGFKGREGEISRVDGSNTSYVEFGNCVFGTEEDLDIESKDLFVIPVDDIHTSNSNLSKTHCHGNVDDVSGSNAGDGGASGLGANPGSNIIIALNGTHKVTQSARAGALGTGGVGGIGGEPGNSSKSRVFDCEQDLHVFMPIPATLLFICTTTNQIHLNQSGRGLDGRHNYTETGRVRPRSPEDQKSYQGLTRYKVELLKNAYVNWEDEKLFIAALASNVEIRSTFRIPGFIYELTRVESNHQHIHLTHVTSYYASALKSIAEWEAGKGLDSQDQFVLRFLKGSIMSTILRVRSTDERLMVTDIKSYLVGSDNGYKIINQLGKGVFTTQLKAGYLSFLQKNIAEVYNYSNTYIINEFDKFSDESRENTLSLLMEIAHLQKRLGDNKAELLEKKAELERSWFLRKVANFFKGVGSVLSMFGGIAGAVGAGLEIGSSSVEALALGQKTAGGLPKLPELPAGVHFALNSFDVYLKNQLRHYDEKVKLVGVITKYLVEVPNLPANVMKNANKLQRATKLDRRKQVNFETINRNKKIVDDGNRQLQTSLKAMKTNNTRVNNTIKGLELADKVSKGVGMAINAFQKLSNDEELNNVLMAIESTEETMENVGSYEDQVHDILQPLLTNIYADLVLYKKSFKNKSRASLSISQWTVSKYIRDVALIVKKFTESFKIEERFVISFQRLEELSGLLISLFDRIEIYQEQKVFAEYIGDLFAVNDPLDHVHKAEYRTAIRDLKIAIQKNVVIRQVNHVVNAFKQHVFPFANQRSYSLEESEMYSPVLTLDMVVSRAKQKHEDISQKLIEIKSSIENHKDEHIKCGDFSSDFRSSRPFYVWNSEQFEPQLLQLLEGRKIRLFADVRLNPNTENAVKFILVTLDLRTHYDNRNELKHTLDHYGVRMTHLGDSHYRCDERYFKIDTDSLSFSYSFETNKYGTPVKRNTVYEKILKGDIQLSPYATWEFQLVDEARAGFGALRRFRGRVSLELSGRGQYVDSRSDIWGTGLEQVYQLYSPRGNKVY